MPRPLILLTRPTAASERVALSLKDLGAPILKAPLQAIEPSGIFPDLSLDELIITTSAHAAAIVAYGRRLDGFKAAVVGERSAQIMTNAGADVRFTCPTATDLVQAISSAGKSEPCHYLRGKFTSVNLEEMLKNAGLETHSTQIYTQRPLPPGRDLQDALRGDIPLIVPLYSARSAGLMDDVIEQVAVHAKLVAVCISDQVAERCWSPSWMQRQVAQAANGPAMIKEIRRAWAELH